MKNIVSAKLKEGVNIKTRDGIIFGGEKVYPPFSDNIQYDIENNPSRWELELPKKKKPTKKESKVTKEAKVKK